MGSLNKHQVVQCINHTADRLGTSEAEAFADLRIGDIAERLQAAARAHKAAEDALITDRKETAEVEAEGAGFRRKIYDVALVLARALDLHEIMGEVDAPVVIAARGAVFQGRNSKAATGSFARASSFVARLEAVFETYPWLDVSGTLRQRATELNTRYAAFLTRRELELQQDTEALQKAHAAETALFAAYLGFKEMVRGQLRFRGADKKPMQALFLDEDPRWAARLAGRRAKAATADKGQGDANTTPPTGDQATPDTDDPPVE